MKSNRNKALNTLVLALVLTNLMTGIVTHELTIEKKEQIEPKVTYKVPKFSLTQKVNYLVNPFYKLVCSGTGVIDSYEHSHQTGEVTYRIHMSKKDVSRGCYETAYLEESEIIVPVVSVAEEPK